MLSPYYLYYIGDMYDDEADDHLSNAKPELWNNLKEKHTCDVKGLFDYDRVSIEVTDLREGGDVRGFLLAV
jgi:hypothetical protein